VLFILGDLFEYWIGDDDLDDPFNAGRLTCCAARSTWVPRICFMAGNRDFLLGDASPRRRNCCRCCPETAADRRRRHGDPADARRHAVHRRPALPGIPPHGALPAVAGSAFLARPLAERHAEVEPAPRSAEAKQGKRPRHHGCQSRTRSAQRCFAHAAPG
jgi:hypothetical protein